MSNLQSQKRPLLEDEDDTSDRAREGRLSLNGDASSSDVATAVAAPVVAEKQHWTSKYKVGLYALLLLVASTGNSICFKKMTNAMTNYPYFLSQLSTFVYLPIFGAIVLYQMRFTNSITEEMRQFPKRKFGTMGLFDALSGLCMLFGGIHTSVSFQALLINCVIPVTMVLSILFLRTKYLKTQYVGATVIMAGVCVVLIPVIIDGGGTSGNSVLFNIIFLLSTIPQAASSVYKELAFGDTELDVNYLQFYVAVYQFFLGLILAPVNSLPFLQDAYIPIDQLHLSISNGGKCLVGINSIVNATVYDQYGNATGGTCWMDEAHKWNAPANTHCDDCSGAWLPVMLYIFFNCLYNLAIVLVIKYGSAALLWIVLTVRLPLVQMASALPFLFNPPDTFRVTSIIGLLVILGGLICYRWQSVSTLFCKPKQQSLDERLLAGNAVSSDGAGTAASMTAVTNTHSVTVRSNSFSHQLTHASTME